MNGFLRCEHVCKMQPSSFAEWINEPVVKNYKTKRNKDMKEPTYKIFTEMAEALSPDMLEEPLELEFWKELFTTASYSKFPRRFSYRGGALVYKRGGRTSTRSLSQDAKQAVKEAINFFDKYGVVATSSAPPKFFKFPKAQEKIHVTWEAADKTMRENLVSDYVDLIKNKLGLNKHQVASLREAISVGLILKTLRPEDIVIKNNSIASINNLYMEDSGSFSTDNARMVIKPCVIPVRTSLPPLDLGKRWRDYLKKLGVNTIVGDDTSIIDTGTADASAVTPHPENFNYPELPM